MKDLLICIFYLVESNAEDILMLTLNSYIGIGP
jgi:hypothetical protein